MSVLYVSITEVKNIKRNLFIKHAWKHCKVKNWASPKLLLILKLSFNTYLSSVSLACDVIRAMLYGVWHLHRKSQHQCCTSLIFQFSSSVSLLSFITCITFFVPRHPTYVLCAEMRCLSHLYKSCFLLKYYYHWNATYLNYFLINFHQKKIDTS